MLRNVPQPGQEQVLLVPRIALFQPGVNQPIVLIENGMEAELLADAQHALVVGQDHGADTLDPLVAADGEEPAEYLGPQTAPLERVADLKGELGLVFIVHPAQPTHGDDLALPGLGVPGLGHQRHLAVKIDEADSGQPLVGNAPAQLQGLEETQVNGVLR